MLFTEDTNEEEVWTILKKDMEVYNRIREEAGLEGLEESDIDRQTLNWLHTVPCTGEIVKQEDSDEDFEECIEVGKRVDVTNFGSKLTEYFLKQFVKVKTVERSFVKRGKEKEFRGKFARTKIWKDNVNNRIAIFMWPVLQKLNCKILIEKTQEYSSSQANIPVHNLHSIL